MTERHNKMMLVLFAVFCISSFGHHSVFSEEPKAEAKLKVILMLGQAEMVGQARINSVGYMLHKPAVPPREVTINAHKAMIHQINGAYLYWQGLDAYVGPKKKKRELTELITQRAAFKADFKQKVVAELEKSGGVFRGKKYAKRGKSYRGFWLFNLCDEECEAAGYTPKIRAILDASDNEMDLVTSYDKLLQESDNRYAMQLELNKKLLRDTTSEKVSLFSVAAKSIGTEMKKKKATVQEQRSRYAELAQKHLSLPIAQRTHIVSISTEAEEHKGPLSVGYGQSPEMFGPEYAAGMAIESQIEGPILILKAVVNSNRGGILEHWNPSKEGAPSTMWDITQNKLTAIFDNPKEYHPEANDGAGIEVAGVIWFQGMSERHNSDYGIQLEDVFRRLSAVTQNTSLPLVCGTVGNAYFSSQSDSLPINIALRQLETNETLVKRFSVVDTRPHFPAELSQINSLIFKNKLKDSSLSKTVSQSTGAKGKRFPPYLGSASFYLLAGNAFGSRLAKIILSNESNQ